MPTYKITELPVYSPQTVDIMEIAIADHRNVIHRVDKLKAICNTEEEAIQRVKDIFNSGMKVFILPYKP